MSMLFQVFESFRFAWVALKSNLLRTILSLLGVTVGIFAIITVLTLVDSLYKNIKDSFNFLGTNVIYMTKFPWDGGNSDGVGGERNWWTAYLKRPNPSYNEYKFLKANLKNRSALAIYAIAGNVTVKYHNNSIGQVAIRGVSEGYNDLFDVDIASGRYFTTDELGAGRNIALIGYEVAKSLFGEHANPVGNSIKLKGLKFIVIGVIKKQGQSFLGTPSNDYATIIPYDSFRKFYLTGTGRQRELGSIIGFKGNDFDIGLVSLENDIRGLIRSRRGLKPVQKDSFSLNRPEAIVKMIEPVFNTMTVAGWIIGGFSILVGGFGIANIMFVSVKERTSVIGLQKSLGARNYFILFQFLFEAIFLSLIGGLGGLLFVYLITFIPLGDLVVALTIKNIVLGLGVSSVIGFVSGIVPASLAARMDPVVAIRAA
jgi:putative ABC transport system permease protein